eukprot:GSMAST32.ASY1.ANO1.1064.1 assembled CDS
MKKRKSTDDVSYDTTLSLNKYPLRLRCDRDVLYAAVSDDGNQLAHACRPLQDDINIVRAAVQQNGFALQFASIRLRNIKKRNILLRAIQSNGLILSVANESIQADREMVKAAVIQSGIAIQYAAKNLQTDKIIACKEKPLKWRKEDYIKLMMERKTSGDRYYKDIVTIAVQESGYNILKASKELQNDRELLLLAVRTTGIILWLLPELQCDREIVLAAVNQNGKALKFACDNLKQDVGVVNSAVLQNALALQFALIEPSHQVIIDALHKYGFLLQFLSTKMRSNKNIVKIAVQQDGLNLKFASPNIRQDIEVAKIAVGSNRKAILFLPYSIQKEVLKQLNMFVDSTARPGREP